MQASSPALLLQAAIPPNLVTPIMLALMFGVFYFFILRPQARRQRQQADFEAGVKKGDRVVTTSGIIGKVTKVDREAGTVTLETGRNVYLDFTAGAVSRDQTVAQFGDPDAA